MDQYSTPQSGITIGEDAELIAEKVFVGLHGQSSAHVVDGGQVSSDLLEIGYWQPGYGSLEIIGPDSMWTVSGECRIGDDGSGFLQIRESGSLVCGSSGLSTGSQTHGGAARL